MLKQVVLATNALIIALFSLAAFAISPGAGQAQTQNNMQQMQQNKQQVRQNQQQQNQQRKNQYQNQRNRSY